MAHTEAINASINLVGSRLEMGHERNKAKTQSDVGVSPFWTLSSRTRTVTPLALPETFVYLSRTMGVNGLAAFWAARCLSAYDKAPSERGGWDNGIR